MDGLSERRYQPQGRASPSRRAHRPAGAGATQPTLDRPKYLGPPAEKRGRRTGLFRPLQNVRDSRYFSFQQLALPHLFPCLPALRKASSILSSFLPPRWLPSISPSPRDIFPCHRPSLYIQPPPLSLARRHRRQLRHHPGNLPYSRCSSTSL